MLRIFPALPALACLSLLLSIHNGSISVDKAKELAARVSSEISKQERVLVYHAERIGHALALYVKQ